MSQKRDLRKEITKNLRDAFDYLHELEFNTFKVVYLARFGAMACAGILFLIFMHRILSFEDWKIYWKAMAAYLVPPMGKESIIPIVLYNNISPVVIGFSIWIFDIMMGYMILTNWWLIQSILSCSKTLNKAFNRVQTRTQNISKKRYGKLLPLILLIFMVIPFLGSGAITTSIIGSGLGFKDKHIVFIVAIGSFVSITIITLIYYNILNWTM